MKKILISFLITITLLAYSYEDPNLAKIYIEKAFSYYKGNQYDICKEYLDRSFSYSNSLPEYYYISNLTTDNNSSNNYIRYSNALSIEKYIKNSFMVKEYSLLNHIAKVYKSVREFEKSFNIYKEIFKIDDIGLKKDYLECIDMLFYSKLTDSIPVVINRAKSISDDDDIYYYELLWEVSYKKIDGATFEKKLSRLNSVNYNPTKILYLITLGYQDVNRAYERYNEIKESIDQKWAKLIIFNLINNSSVKEQDVITTLLEDWIKNSGLKDIKTNSLITNLKTSDIILNNNDLNNLFLNYSGERYQDSDNDYIYEKIEIYDNGILISEIFDQNQDGLKEYRINYLKNGEYKNLTIYKDNSNFDIYNYNELNQSLKDIEVYKKGVLTEKTTLLKSTIFPKVEEILANNDLASEYIDYKETFGAENSLIKYSKKNIIYEYVDSNRNGYYEYKKYYKDGIIDYAIKDTDENGYYEIKEIYKDKKLEAVLYKTDDTLKTYNYIESIYANRVEKVWDDNNDGIFEIKYVEYKNGENEILFDINFDGVYDFVIVTKNNKNSRELYEIKNGKYQLVKKFGDKVEKKSKNWVIVSPRDVDKLIIPDQIDINDNKTLSGIYHFNNKKKFFENGKIIDEQFVYGMFFFNDFLYLIDTNIKM